MTRLGRSACLVIAVALAAIVAGCGLLPISGRATSPRTCKDVYSQARCEAMLTAAAEQLGVRDEDVSSIEIAPDPTPRPDGVIETYSGGRPLIVLAHLGDEVRPVQMCAGVPSSPACMDRPAWTVRTPIGPSAGYQDIPCAGEPPDGCASPVPSPDVGTEATATPLRIDDRVIPVPEVGAYEVKLGEASLPNGILRVAGAELADPWPAALRLSNDGIRLVVRSLVPGRPPFMNLYEHGWWPGVEPVEVLLVFDVRHAGPGATLEIRDVDVG